MKLAIAGVPKAGKTTLADKIDSNALHTDDLIDTHNWSEASQAASEWFNKDEFVIEGVAVPRALRKWLKANKDNNEKPCDTVVWLDEPWTELTKGQLTMAKGCKTVMSEIFEDLTTRGTDIVTEWKIKEIEEKVQRKEPTITKEDIGLLFIKVKDQVKLRGLLQQIFSKEENMEVFSQVCFPETVTNKTPDFHKDIYSFLIDPDNGALAAPRGHGKTSATGVIFLSWSIVNKLEDYIVYISQNFKKTVQFIDPIRYEFKFNKMLRFIYGDLTPKAAKDDGGKDREDCFDVNGIRVEAVSFDQNLRGFKYRNKRPSLIIGDDIEDDARVTNPELRDKDANKLNKIIIPALDIDGRFKFIGTILHSYSLLNIKIGLWKGKIFRACDENMENLLWPDRFTKDKLMKIKDPSTGIGPVAFQQEYMNDPVDNKKSLIKKHHIEACFREDISSQDLRDMNFELKTLGVDFAFEDKVTSDKSAFVGLGVKDEFYYLLHCQTEKGMSAPEQMKMIKHEINPMHNFDKIGLEENSIKSISKDIDQWNLPITLFWTASADPAARKKEDYDFTDKRHTVGKINMINRLATAFENKQFIIPYKTEQDKNIAHTLVSECTSYSLAAGKLIEAGVHPDIPIGLGYALELINLGNEGAWAFA